MPTQSPNNKELLIEIAELSARLEEAEETLGAIRRGEVDALVVQGTAGPQVYSLQSAEAESNRFRGEILNQISEVVIATDLEQRITYFNAAAERQYGVRSDDVMGRHIDEVYTKQWPNAEAEANRLAALRDHGNWSGELIQRLPDGRVLDVEVSVSAIRGQDGTQNGLLAVIHNVSRRKQEEEVLRQNAMLFSTLISQAPMGTYVVNSQFRLQQVNAVAMPVFENVQPLIDRDFSEVMEIIWGSEVGTQCVAIFRHTLDTGERYISPPFTHQRQDLGLEQSYEWETQRITLPDGKYGVVCYFHDVTERIHALYALRAGADRMRLAAETTGLGFWELNVITNTVQWDAVMFEIYGIEPTSDGVISYNDWREAVLPEDLAESEAILNDCVRRQGQCQHIFRICRRNDGECRYISVVATVRENELGQVQVIGTNIDITARKQVEEELRRLATELSEADRRKNEFLAMLGHELRNPLTPISNMVQVLSFRPIDEQTLSKACEVLNRNVSHISLLVDDLLDVSRITRGLVTIKRQPLELVKLLKETSESIQTLLQSKQQTFHFEIPPQPIYLDGDPVRLTQVFSNLLTNASKYTDVGGHIDLTINVEDALVIVHVRDNGMGIEPQLLPHVFDLFTQGERGLDRSEGGLGLGLTLVKTLVNMHGGQVEAYSPGTNRGSEFVVKLPIIVESPVQANPVNPPTLNKDNEQGMRILMIDDNVDVVESISLFLEMSGHQVKTANNGAQGISAAQSFAPDIILLDIGLPDINGYQVAKKLRELPCSQGVLIVAMSGYAPNNDNQSTQPDNFDHYLVKPPKISELQNLINNFQRLKQ